MTDLPNAFDPKKILEAMNTQSHITLTAAARRAARNEETLKAHATAIDEKRQALMNEFQLLAQEPSNLAKAWFDYLKDSAQRMVLFADAMRQYSDTVKAHNDAGAPPVLVFDSEKVMDGQDLPRPCNYFLLRLLPEPGIEIDMTKRPVVIIDPRAGHGGGIGGFKHDSQVGVAFKRGHPVYFVAFHQAPLPHQTIAMITDAEAAFLREVERLHPDAPKPIVIGNCQGGWAAAILAATHPDLTGPMVLNGAPMSYWAGKLGKDMMRYSGGLAGGALPAMLSGDTSGGIFDGADLVANFEMLNPGRNWFGKYFDLYQTVDTGVQRFLDFERWWGGFYLLTTEEMTWIVEQLFVGNRLAKNTAQLEPGRPIDLKNIKAPIICFASHGDNITPPAQALDWIMDAYSSEEEIELQGQRILYMLHDQVGHLGIFVSSKIANREDVGLADTLEIIEALPPGLYEMKVVELTDEDDEKRFTLSIQSSTFADIIAATGERDEEAAFAAVARGSEALTEAYEATIRPFVINSSNPEIGQLKRDLHPMRVSRRMFTSDHPGMAMVEKQAEAVRKSRTAVDDSNPFRQTEKLWGELIETAWDAFRDLRETAIEMSFLNIYTSPWAMMYGAKRNQERPKQDLAHLAQTPEVRACLARIDRGGVTEALVRGLILSARALPQVHQDTLAAAFEALRDREPLRSLSHDATTEIVREQTVICTFAHDEALRTLPKLIRNDADLKVVLDAIALVFGDNTAVPAEVRQASDKVRDHLSASTSKPARRATAKASATEAAAE